MKTSATPGMPRIFDGELAARWHSACSILEPATCTSMGAGRPRFSTASTRPPDEKYAVSSGSSRLHALFHPRHVFVAADLVVVLEAHLHEGGVHARSWWYRSRRNPGVAPILETIMPRSSGGTTWRISASTLATSFSVTDEARAGGRFDIDHELAGVGARKEGEPEQRERAARLAAKTTPKATSVNAGRRSTHAYQLVVDA